MSDREREGDKMNGKIIGYTLRYVAPDFCTCFFGSVADAEVVALNGRGDRPGTFKEIVTLYEGPVVKRFEVTNETRTEQVVKIAEIK